MGWINVERSTFADLGRRAVEFRDGFFTCRRGASAVITLNVANIVHLNRQPKAEPISAAPATDMFESQSDVASAGVLRGVIPDLLGVRGFRNKRHISVQFKDGKAFSGKTDFNTFFAIQNAWLDSK